MNIEVPAPIPAILRHDPSSHYHWLELARRASVEAIADLKRTGWRWSRYREQWYTNRRYYTISGAFDVTDEGDCEYSAERGERLQARADCHRDRSTAAYDRSNASVEHIPLGQPILIGHHSERGHRAALKRSDNAMRKSVEEGKIAADLDYRAKSSARHQAHKQTPGAMQRRVDRLRVEEHQLERIIAAQLPERAERGEETATYAKQCNWRLERVRSEIATLTEAIEAAGGILADQLAEAGIVAEVGDLVKIHGFSGIVKRVNTKTYTIEIRNKGPKGWVLKLDRTRLQEVIAKATDIEQMRRQLDCIENN